MSVLTPRLILLFSGKRKSGKDTITDIIFERVKDKAVLIKISAPIKSHFSESLGLDFNELMSAGEYKEKFRLEMIKWSENIRKSDHGYFCRAAIKMTNAIEKPVWIVSDIRRQTDLQWFRENYKNIRAVRVYSSENERRKRGWIYISGIDDQESECDLDCVEDWDMIINNNSSIGDLQPTIDSIVHSINEALAAS